MTSTFITSIPESLQACVLLVMETSSGEASAWSFGGARVEEVRELMSMYPEQCSSPSVTFLAFHNVHFTTLSHKIKWRKKKWNLMPICFPDLYIYSLKNISWTPNLCCVLGIQWWTQLTLYLPPSRSFNQVKRSFHICLLNKQSFGKKNVIAP